MDIAQIIWFISAAVAAFAVTVMLEKKFIPFLMRIKMGQKILEIGPRWHKSKEGTPTMGGIFFIAAVYAVAVAVMIYGAAKGEFNGEFAIFAVYMLLNGAIGFVDDYTKFVKKQNKGLSAMQKMIAQFAVSALFLLFMRIFGYIDTCVTLPFTHFRLELGIFYYILSLFFMVFMVNSVNLTDGIDGLCASVTLIISLTYALISALTSGSDVSFTAIFGAVTGGMAGFLVYNFHPARIFMGDTGSLFLGAAVVGAAYVFDMPIIAAVAGLIYVVESVSVVIQVTSFKLTHKRVFKMTPIHHHFEMCGWSEVKIVCVFSALTLVFSTVGYLMFM